MRILSCFRVRATAFVVVLAVARLLTPQHIEAQTQPPTYHLQPTDTINIVVTGHPEWSMLLTVRPDGRISYPELGEVEVVGMTIGELAARITNALGEGGHHLRNPQVTINATVFRHPSISVLGAVSKPGPVVLAAPTETMARVLALAGGGSPEADLHRVVLHRGDAPHVFVDLRAQLDGGAPDTVLEDGDVLIVPTVKHLYVGALGNVQRPGTVPIPNDAASMDLQALVLQVGGLAKDADVNRALILRAGGAVEAIQLDKTLKREAPPVTLAAGDALWVLAIPNPEYFVVTGAVKKPGRFPVAPDTTMATALVLGGNPTETADSRKVSLIHADGTSEIIDVDPMLAGKDIHTARLPVKANDILVVPTRRETYAVLGAVRSPGVLLWQEGMRLSDALAKSGGPVERLADLAHVTVVRRGKPGEQPSMTEVNARLLLLGRNEVSNVVLQPGDAIYVPSLAEPFWFRGLSPLTIISLALSLFRAFR